MSEPHVPGHGARDEAPGFLDKPANVDRLLRVFYVLCAGLVAADFFVHRHEMHPWEGLIAFYPIYGFLGIVVLVFVAKLLRRVAMRPEDYYDVD